ncbi:MAG: PorV/PorQ family protein [bacterium]|nr:PorV/PorQ family protein [bacterium]
MKSIKIVITIVCSLFVCVQLYAGAGTTGGVILKESLGARSLAMGDAFTAVASGPETIFWNPAGLATMDKPEVSAMYFKEIADMGLMSIQYAQPLAEYGTAGIAIESFSAGDMELNYLDGTSKSVNAQQDVVVNLAYGKELVENFSAGANLKYLNSTLAEAETASTIALDLGCLYRFPQIEGLSFGLNLQNMGGGMKYIEEEDPLSFTMRAGAAFTKALQNNALTISGDLSKPKELSNRFNLGAEYVYNQVIAIRAGYKFGYDVDSFTAGFGVKISRYSLDYAFAPKGDLGDNHRISMGIRF